MFHVWFDKFLTAPRFAPSPPNFPEHSTVQSEGPSAASAGYDLMARHGASSRRERLVRSTLKAAWAKFGVEDLDEETSEYMLGVACTVIAEASTARDAEEELLQCLGPILQAQDERGPFPEMVDMVNGSMNDLSFCNVQTVSGWNISEAFGQKTTNVQVDFPVPVMRRVRKALVRYGWVEAQEKEEWLEVLAHRPAGLKIFDKEATSERPDVSQPFVLRNGVAPAWQKKWSRDSFMDRFGRQDFKLRSCLDLHEYSFTGPWRTAALREYFEDRDDDDVPSMIFENSFLPPPLHQALWSGGQRPEVLSHIHAEPILNLGRRHSFIAFHGGSSAMWLAQLVGRSAWFLAPPGRRPEIREPWSYVPETEVCRSVDRLSAIVRGPEVPAEAEATVVQKLRNWIGDLQDIGELFRGVAPNPIQEPLTGGGPGEVRASAPLPPVPPPPPVPGVEGRTPERGDRGGRRAGREASERPPVKEEERATSSKRSRRRHKEEPEDRQSRERKRDRRSRSGRSAEGEGT
eukprot:s2053_g13.t1